MVDARYAGREGVIPLREFSREQAWLLPPTLLPEDHGGFVAFVDSIAGWEELGVSPQWGGGLPPPDAPWGRLYGFCAPPASWRRPAGSSCPTCRESASRPTLWRFYCEHREKMRGLFRRTVKTAVEAGLVNLVLQAVDGTRISGNPPRTAPWTTRGLGGC